VLVISADSSVITYYRKSTRDRSAYTETSRFSKLMSLAVRTSNMVFRYYGCISDILRFIKALET
jgi:hypothetical protein